MATFRTNKIILRLELTAAATHALDVSPGDTDADGDKINFDFDAIHNYHIFQGPVLGAGDTFSVYGDIGGNAATGTGATTTGWVLIGTLTAAAESQQIIQAKGGFWTRFKLVGTSLSGTHNVTMVSRIPDSVPW
jgi:hypothetical protein